MRTAAVTITLITITTLNCDDPVAPLEETQERGWALCSEQDEIAKGLGLSDEQRKSVLGCCESLGGQCNCASPEIAACEKDAECGNDSTCVSGWCVHTDQCTQTESEDGSVCPRYCMQGDQYELCDTHLTCWDPNSKLCLACQVCDECDPGCDITSNGLACKDGRVAPMHSCAQIVALRYKQDKPNQWVQIRNMCAYTNSVVSVLKVGDDNGWSHLVPGDIPQLQPGQCYNFMKPAYPLKDTDLTGIAEGVGLFTKSAANACGAYPRDYVLYGYDENKHNLQGTWLGFDAFGFGGNHDAESHSYRDSFRSWGNAWSNEPQPCL